MAKKIIAVEFDDLDVPTSHALANAIHSITELVDGNVNVYTQNFKPRGWAVSDATIKIDRN